MVWTKLDDGFPDNPKLLRAIAKAGDVAGWLWVCGINYCNRHLTDGFIQAEVIPRILVHKRPLDVAAALVASGCWDVADGGYQVHDFLDHNPSRADVEASREATRKRVQEYRGRRLQNERDGNAAVTSDVTRYSGVSTPVVRAPSPLLSDPDPIRSQPTVAPRVCAHEDSSPDEPVSVAPASGAFALSPLDPEPPKSEPKRQRRSAIRDDFAPSEANREFAVKRGFNAETLERERLRFVNYWKSRGEPRADWSAGFRNWLDRAEPSGGGTNGYRSPNPTPVNAMQNTGYAPGTKLATPETSL